MVFVRNVVVEPEVALVGVDAGAAVVEVIVSGSHTVDLRQRIIFTVLASTDRLPQDRSDRRRYWQNY